VVAEQHSGELVAALCRGLQLSTSRVSPHQYAEVTWSPGSRRSTAGSSSGAWASSGGPTSCCWADTLLKPRAAALLSVSVAPRGVFARLQVW